LVAYSGQLSANKVSTVITVGDSQCSSVENAYIPNYCGFHKA